MTVVVAANCVWCAGSARSKSDWRAIKILLNINIPQSDKGGSPASTLQCICNPSRKAHKQYKLYLQLARGTAQAARARAGHMGRSREHRTMRVYKQAHAPSCFSSRAATSDNSSIFPKSTEVPRLTVIIEVYRVETEYI